MTPTVWGPILWELLFATAWYCCDEHMKALRDILLKSIPLLLPCHHCRLHFLFNHPKATRRANGEPENADHAFLWLYYLKDEVNKSLKPPVSSVAYSELRARYELEDGFVLNDVRVSSLLVLMAIEARELGREKDFVAFCQSLAPLLPVAIDSDLPVLLSMPWEGAVTKRAVEVANAVRRSRGVQTRALAHFKKWGDA